MKYPLFTKPLVLFGAAFLAGSTAFAEGPTGSSISPSTVVVSGPAGQVTLAELELIVKETVPPIRRDEFWSNPASVGKLARNIYAQRALAQEAQQAGLDKTAEGAAYMKLTRERALTELAMQARVRAKTPDAKAQEAYARGEYKAQPQRFALPDQVHARHILLPVAKDGANDAAVKAEAEKLIAQLRQGADFAKLARDHSGDKGSAGRGGDLGVFSRGKMVPAFENAAFALEKPGDLSPPVRTDFGYHIIELIERRSARALSFEEALPSLREELLNRVNAEERVRSWGATESAATVHEDDITRVVNSRRR